MRSAVVREDSARRRRFNQDCVGGQGEEPEEGWLGGWASGLSGWQGSAHPSGTERGCGWAHELGRVRLGEGGNPLGLPGVLDSKSVRTRTSPVVQGTWVQSLLWDDSTCL